MNIKALFMLSSTTLMSGCASMLSIGETDYACRGLPGDPLCASVHDVYEASSTSNYQQGLQTLRDRKKAERDEGEDSSLSHLSMVSPPHLPRQVQSPQLPLAQVLLRRLMELRLRDRELFLVLQAR